MYSAHRDITQHCVIAFNALVIPAVQWAEELNDRPLNEGKVLGFSFSSSCTMTIANRNCIKIINKSLNYYITVLLPNWLIK